MSITESNSIQSWTQRLLQNDTLDQLIQDLPKILNETLSFYNVSRLNQIIKPLMESFSNVQAPEGLSQFLTQNMNADTLTQLVMGYITSRINALKTSAACTSEVSHLINGLASLQPWALKMLDASAKIPSRLLELNLHWYGSYDECYSDPLAAKLNLLPTDHSIPSVESKYCTATINLPLPVGSDQFMSTLTGGGALKLGVCVPKSCNEEELKILTNSLLSTLPIGNMSVNASSLSCPTTQRQFEPADIGVIVLCGVFAVVLSLGTLYDLMVNVWPKYKSKKDMKIKEESESSGNNNENKYERREKENVSESKNVNVNEPGIMENIFLSFSLYTNGKKLLNTSQPKGSLTAVNGIRFFSMTWVILGHTLGFSPVMGMNVASYSIDFLQRRSAQAIINATVSVDSFFVLSGLLTSYLALKQMSKSKGKINWFMYYFHRYWRLTPVYMIMIGLYVTIYPHLTYGPSQPPRDTACPNAWWWNLLYINNFTPDMTDFCMGWSWYLNNDMQFYVLSPLMLLPLFFKEVIGIIVCVVILLGTTIFTGILSYNKHMPPSTIGGGEHPEAGTDYFQDYYIKPWARIGPYIIGILTGYLLYRTKCKCRMNIFVNLGCWAAATGIACAVLYGLYDAMNGNPLSDEVSAAYNALNRTAWGISVCWVIFACATGNGGPINTLLSWSAFVPLARLTYCAYLCHPVVIYVYYGSLREPLYMTDLTLVYLFLAHLTVSYGIAFILSLSFESPFMALEKVIFKHNGTKRPS